MREGIKVCVPDTTRGYGRGSGKDGRISGEKGMREEGPGRHSRVQVDRGRAERQIDKFNLLIYFVPFPPILLVEGDQGVTRSIGYQYRVPVSGREGNGKAMGRQQAMGG